MLSPDMMLPTGPPPQAVLDQRWLWKGLLFLLLATFVLRMVSMDIAGALLSALMLGFGVIMIRDGMQEMPKYALVYAVLCGLNFFFDVLPLITELGGRITRVSTPNTTVAGGSGRHQESSYTITTKFTPFFCAREGLVYNLQSLSMILSPIAMALGVYLAITATNELQRQLRPIFEDDFRDFGAAVGGGAPGGGARAAVLPHSQGAGTSQASAGRDTAERFHGRGHKLGDFPGTGTTLPSSGTTGTPETSSTT